MYLYETHLPVRSTEESQAFYLDAVSLEFAHRDPTRDVIFLWIGRNKRSMLGLWRAGAIFISVILRSHYHCPNCW